MPMLSRCGAKTGTVGVAAGGGCCCSGGVESGGVESGGVESGGVEGGGRRRSGGVDRLVVPDHFAIPR